MSEKTNGSTHAMSRPWPGSRPQRAEERAGWLARFERSGLSLAAFCREQQLPYWTLKYWMRCAREARSVQEKLVEVPAAAAGEISGALAGSAADRRVTIRLTNRLEIEIPSGTDPRWIAALIREVLTCSG